LNIVERSLFYYIWNLIDKAKLRIHNPCLNAEQLAQFEFDHIVSKERPASSESLISGDHQKKRKSGLYETQINARNKLKLIFGVWFVGGGVNDMNA